MSKKKETPEEKYVATGLLQNWCAYIKGKPVKTVGVYSVHSLMTEANKSKTLKNLRKYGYTVQMVIK